ncbi:aminotransferase class I/II-fold pyridoxal phosphate-dependent enzyme [Cellulomonas hominis]|uniref:aminotransferase class I/II-fold pyridoxal phosphate-dependent enzyme n=1 Tax=Cellulomonas hominis TaxID=156981 RepID=UPI001B933FA0|nr:aminotransferase class I/II-fold pyridoxal phosphate-dependent enzyme [Cellulomonas hominis]VTR75989.1 8-amino-7-oxononanoate synthase [Cellulomonas hominis]
MGWKDERYRRYRDLRDTIEQDSGGFPYGKSRPTANTHEYTLSGDRVLNFSSYDYLGLGQDERVRAFARECITRYGISTGASRLVSGELDIHGQLERELASFLGREAALLFVSGHATNVSVLGFLFGPADYIVHDQYIHNSVLEGIRLSRAQRASFKHNSVSDLERILLAAPSSARRLVVCIEGLYSMDGDHAPLQEILELKRRFRFLLVMDEAHSVGTTGRTGRGLTELSEAAPGEVDVLIGTLSKSLGSCGGFVAASAELVEYLRNGCPGFVFSTGIPAPVTGAAYQALRCLVEQPALVEELGAKAEQFRASLREVGLDPLGVESAPIVPVRVPARAVYGCAQNLRSRGVDVYPISYPAVSPSAARLRFFLSRRHRDEDLITTARAVADAVAESGRAS